MKKKLLLLVLVMLSTEAFAIMQTNTTVTLVGTEGHGAQVYVGIDQNPNNCPQGGIYFKTASELSQVLSVALAAKMANKLVRIDYDLPTANANFCQGTGIYAQ